MKSMKRLVEKPSWKAGESAWSGYRQDHTYSDEDDRLNFEDELELRSIVERREALPSRDRVLFLGRPRA